MGENKIILGDNEIKLGESEIKLVSNEIVSDDEINVTNSEDSFEASLDTEAKLFVLLDSYYKITLTSYNSMAATGSGSRHCFICNTEVEPDVFKQHIDHHDHKNNMQKYKFLDKYKNNLIRQSRLTYHCAICNVIVYRSDLPAHLECNPHKQLMKQNSAITKKQRKNQMKAGLALYKVETQNEVIYKKMKEKQIIFHLRAIITD
ncbi:uncharacterized protein LOC131841954 [Achroia grisella]|uniref:uncharacterized protein LOC131841954 n=1 Tax=Achroia grisella TaxID=688607 RepID=UPI0027D33695|nr:uncharacterized protein LOC131841954 [Achroia grisella]